VMSLARTSFAKDPMLAVATVSVLSRPRFLCRFTATSLACEEMMRRANNRNPNSMSARKVQQKKVEDVRAAAEIASKKKHSPARKHFGASSIFPLAFVSGRACWFGGSGPADTGPADTGPPDSDPGDIDSTATGSADIDPADTGQANAASSGTDTSDTGSADSGPADTDPAGTDPSDIFLADFCSADVDPACTDPADDSPTESDPAGTDTADTGSADSGRGPS